MTVEYAVTFEFDMAPPITHRGTVVASVTPALFARATRQAIKANPGLRWTSMVCVLLERLDTARGVAAGETAEDVLSAGQ